jgi:galactokinase
MSLLSTWAPGRVNLIGEHTDYSGGLVLPAAIQLGLRVDVRRRSRETTLSSTLFGTAPPFAADGSGQADGWARFGHAVAGELAALGRPPVGIDAAISSTLPAGSGLSSSAALEVGLALALCAVADFEIDPLELAGACRRAEERAVGVPCGILDQAACILGHRDAALLLDCSSLEHTLISIPTTAVLLVIDSGMRRRLEHSGYADRRRELEAALAGIGASSPRELTLEDIESLDPTLRRRLRHVITENERVVGFADALLAGDLPAAGRLMTASHASLRDDYEVSLPELDELVAIAEACGAFGARLLGGGFGGSVLALVPATNADKIARVISRGHRHCRPPIAVHASEGARVSDPRVSGDG